MTTVKRKNLSARKIRSTVFITVMLALPLLQFLVFTLYTNINTFIMAFQMDDGKGRAVFAGFYNIRSFITEWKIGGGMWPRAILNSLGYLPMTVLVNLPVSIIVAYFLFKKVPLAGLYKVIFFFPNVISVVVMALAFRSMFDYSTGPVNNLLTNVFGVSKDSLPIWLMDEKLTMPLLYLYALWAGIGYNCILLFGAFARVPKEIEESAALDGCGVWREIFGIYIPIMWPTITTMTVFGISTVFGMFIHTQVLTNSMGSNGSTWTIASLIMGKIKSNVDKYSAAMLSILVTVIGVPSILLTKKGMEKVIDTVEV